MKVYLLWPCLLYTYYDRACYGPTSLPSYLLLLCYKAVERCHELQRHVALLADQDGRHVPSDTGVKTRDIGVMTR